MTSTKRLPSWVGWSAVAIGLAVAIFFGRRGYRAWQDARIEAAAQATYTQAKCMIVAARPTPNGPQWDVTFTSGAKILHATIQGAKTDDVGAHRVGSLDPCFYPPSEPKLALWEIPQPPAPALLIPIVLGVLGLAVVGFGIRTVVRARRPS